MSEDRPESVEEYRKWFEDRHRVLITDRTQTYYESVSNKILRDFSRSDFWNALVSALESINQEYYLKTGYNLLSMDTPELKAKPFKSFVLKTFRKNVLENPNWPEQPPGGWILPTNWYSRINDITRSVIVVKYLDGVNFLVENVRLLLREYGLSFQVDFEAREEGYYAAHVYTQYDCEVPAENWDVERIQVMIEIQITTQLQEVIRGLLHKYYEARRRGAKDEGVKWQWDYASDEFAANYLGHILHYVEGMIVDIRERQKEPMV
jgi:ppGpp synthetase/RelA/SpoT-type nucleotidyltranferase